MCERGEPSSEHPQVELMWGNAPLALGLGQSTCESCVPGGDVASLGPQRGLCHLASMAHFIAECESSCTRVGLRIGELRSDMSCCWMGTPIDWGAYQTRTCTRATSRTVEMGDVDDTRVAVNRVGPVLDQR